MRYVCFLFFSIRSSLANLEATDGRIVIAAYDGELTVKRLRFLKDRPYLMPENSSYSPLPVSEENDCYVWGVVTNVIHPL